MKDIEKRIAVLFSAVQPLSEAFRPVFSVEQGSGGRRVTGTAIVIGDGIDRFIVTANHVLDEPGPKFVGVRGEQPVPWPRRYSKLLPTSPKLPDADLAWAHAIVKTDDLQLKGSIPMALAVAALNDSVNAVYVAVGYPVSRAKVRMGERRVAAKLMFAVVSLAPHEEWVAVEANEQVQMVFTYSQEGRIDSSGLPAVGAHPRGMSGGGVFLITRGEGEQESVPAIPFLVGILTQFHESRSVLVATRIRRMWEAIGIQRSSGPQLYVRSEF